MDGGVSPGEVRAADGGRCRGTGPHHQEGRTAVDRRASSGFSGNRTSVTVYLGQDPRHPAVEAVVPGDRTPVTVSLGRDPCYLIIAGDPPPRKAVRYRVVVSEGQTPVTRSLQRTGPRIPRPVGLSASQSVCWSAGLSIDCPVGWSVKRSVGRLFSRSACQLVDWSVRM